MLLKAQLCEGSWVRGWMTCGPSPLMLKEIDWPSHALLVYRMAARSDPAPLSLVLVTTLCACAPSARVSATSAKAWNIQPDPRARRGVMVASRFMTRSLSAASRPRVAFPSSRCSGCFFLLDAMVCGGQPPRRVNATAPELPPRLYIRPARWPVLPVKNPSKLPVAPAPQLGWHEMLSGFGLGTPE